MSIEYLPALPENILHKIMEDCSYKNLVSLSQTNKLLFKRVYKDYIETFLNKYKINGVFVTESVAQIIKNSDKRAFEFSYELYKKVFNAYYESTSGLENVDFDKNIFCDEYSKIDKKRHIRVYNHVEAPYWADHKIKNGNVLENREILGFPYDKPEIYVISPSDEYPYPGVSPITNSNNMEVLYIPCSYKCREIRNTVLKRAYF